MKEHPILFSTPMVQAILEGRKTQTRRIVKKNIPENVTTIDRYNKTGQFTLWENRKIVSQIGESPYGQPGDILWVRETFKAELVDVTGKAVSYYYLADNPAAKSTSNKFKPSIHMPKAAARIWLEIIEVKVEKLESISDEDARAEGIHYVVDKITGFCGFDYLNGGYNLMTRPWNSFMSLWRKVHDIERYKPTGNPWVWVVKFKVLSTTGIPSFDYAQDDKGGQDDSNQ
jgi:hypothetical protein